MSRPLSSGFWAVVIPIETSSNMWFFTDPFGDNVWLTIVTCIPIYIIVMGLVYHFYSGIGDWGTVSGFVIRNALSEQNGSLPDHASARVHQKILVIIWLWCTLVLVQAYSGNLTAMLSKPKLDAPIRKLDELLDQDEISWIIRDGSPEERFMRAAQSGSVKNLLHQQAMIMPDDGMNGCESAEIRDSASICRGNTIRQMIAEDFSSTGKCNFYIVREKILSTYYSVAFPVRSISIAQNFWQRLEIVNFRRAATSWRTSIILWTLKIKWGFWGETRMMRSICQILPSAWNGGMSKCLMRMKLLK